MVARRTWKQTNFHVLIHWRSSRGSQRLELPRSLVDQNHHNVPLRSPPLPSNKLNLPGPPSPPPEPKKASPRATVGRSGEAAVEEAKAVVEQEEKVEGKEPVKTAPPALGPKPREDESIPLHFH